MKTITFISLYLFLFFSILNVAFIIYGINEPAFYVKVMIYISILLYYLLKNNCKLNVFFLSILAFLIMSDILNINENTNNLKYTLIGKLITYSLLLYKTIKDLIEMNIKRIDNYNLLYGFLIIIFLSCLIYIALFLVFNPSSNFFLLLIIYASILFLLGILNSLIYMSNFKKEYIYLIMATFCFIISDLFYAIFNYFYEFILLRITSKICFLFSFYFLINYFILYNSDPVKK